MIRNESFRHPATREHAERLVAALIRTAHRYRTMSETDAFDRDEALACAEAAGGFAVEVAREFRIGLSLEVGHAEAC